MTFGAALRLAVDAFPLKNVNNYVGTTAMLWQRDARRRLGPVGGRFSQGWWARFFSSLTCRLAIGRTGCVSLVPGRSPGPDW